MDGFPSREGTFIPTRAQHDLLRACLLSDRAEVSAAFEGWKSAVVFDDIRVGTFRLMPLLYANLKRLGIEDSLIPKMRGIYRQVWFRNRLVIEEGLRAARALREAGIPVILIKGAALAGRVYDDVALRPMEDFDIVVPREDFARAVERTLERGWKLYPEAADRESHFEFQHAVALRKAPPAELDIHWCSIYGAFGIRGEREFWAASIDHGAGGVDVRLLAPADQLLQLCAHASLSSRDVAPVRWVPDAFFLLRREGTSFDWDRLVEMAAVRSLSLVQLRCLEYLRDALAVEVPGQVLAALAANVRWSERLVLRLRTADRPVQRWHAALVWVRLIFVDGLSAVPRRLSLFRRYLRSSFRIPPGVGIPRFVIAKIFDPPE